MEGAWLSVEVAHWLEGPGDAPVVVMSNSLGTTHEMWDPVAGTLSRRFRVLRYDARGHGSSPVPDGPYTVADLGGDVLALLDRLDLPRASFCGLSIGGITGLWLGVHAAERIERLVLCCTAANLPPPEQWLDRAAQVRAAGVAPQANATVERWFTPDFRSRDPQTVRRMREMLVSTPAEGYASCCEALADFDMRDELGAIRAPTLVIAGAHDPVGTPERARHLEAAIDGARLLVLPTRHLAAVEQPEALSQALEEHFEKEANGAR
jgi:3-oxoadipate enol-lactonase